MAKVTRAKLTKKQRALLKSLNNQNEYLKDPTIKDKK